MPIRKPLAAALAALSFAGAGNAAAGGSPWIEVEAAARMSSELPGADRATSVGGNRSISVGGARTETVDAQPARDAVLKGQKILQNAPRLQDVPPTIPASTGILKFDGIDARHAIAINSPLRVMPDRSPAAGGSSNTLTRLETLPKHAPGLAAPMGRR
jgi:hypothetical protein